MFHTWKVQGIQFEAVLWSGNTMWVFNDCGQHMRGTFICDGDNTGGVMRHGHRCGVWSAMNMQEI
jgi:hypothetical protein